MGITTGKNPDAYAVRIINQENYIAALTEKKAEANDACTAADNVKDAAYQNYKSIYTQKEESDNARKQIQKQIEELQADMKIAVSRASVQGKSSVEIDAIKQSYTTKIGLLEGTLSAGRKDNKSITELFEDAKTSYSKAIAQDNSAVGWLLSTLRGLFNAELDLGELKKEQIVNEHFQNQDTARFDRMV